MSAEEIARFVEERAALEDAKENEADYEGARGKGPYLRALARELRETFPDSAIKADRDEPKERRPAWLTRTEATCNNCGGTDGHRTERCHLASDNFYERGFLAGLEAATRR